MYMYNIDTYIYIHTHIHTYIHLNLEEKTSNNQPLKPVPDYLH